MNGVKPLDSASIDPDYAIQLIEEGILTYEEPQLEQALKQIVIAAAQNKKSSRPDLSHIFDQIIARYLPSPAAEEELNSQRCMILLRSLQFELKGAHRAEKHMHQAQDMQQRGQGVQDVQAHLKRALILEEHLQEFGRPSGLTFAWLSKQSKSGNGSSRAEDYGIESARMQSHGKAHMLIDYDLTDSESEGEAESSSGSGALRVNPINHESSSSAQGLVMTPPNQVSGAGLSGTENSSLEAGAPQTVRADEATQSDDDDDLPHQGKHGKARNASGAGGFQKKTPAARTSLPAKNNGRVGKPTKPARKQQVQQAQRVLRLSDGEQKKKLEKEALELEEIQSESSKGREKYKQKVPYVPSPPSRSRDPDSYTDYTPEDQQPLCSDSDASDSSSPTSTAASGNSSSASGATSPATTPTDPGTPDQDKADDEDDGNGDDGGDAEEEDDSDDDFDAGGGWD